jgi:hypothetical protein
MLAGRAALGVRSDATRPRRFDSLGSAIPREGEERIGPAGPHAEAVQLVRRRKGSISELMADTKLSISVSVMGSGRTTS